MRKIRWPDKLKAMKEIKKIAIKAKLNYEWNGNNLIISPHQIRDYAISVKTDTKSKPAELRIFSNGPIEKFEEIKKIFILSELKRINDPIYNSNMIISHSKTYPR